jgi:hypothetical protein
MAENQQHENGAIPQVMQLTRDGPRFYFASLSEVKIHFDWAVQPELDPSDARKHHV